MSSDAAVLDGALAARRSALRQWRRRAGLTMSEAARELGMGERMLAYYEAGTHPVPRALALAVRALEAGLDVDLAPRTARDRWVALVDAMRAYGRGEPVVGRMLRSGRHEDLRTFLAVVRSGPDPRLAMTDPALFRTLRNACTKAQLSGLAEFRVAPKALRRARRLHTGPEPETSEPELVQGRGMTR